MQVPTTSNTRIQFLHWISQTSRYLLKSDKNKLLLPILKSLRMRNKMRMCSKLRMIQRVLSRWYLNSSSRTRQRRRKKLLLQILWPSWELSLHLLNQKMKHLKQNLTFPLNSQSLCKKEHLHLKSQISNSNNSKNLTSNSHHLCLP